MGAEEVSDWGHFAPPQMASRRGSERMRAGELTPLIDSPILCFRRTPLAILSRFLFFRTEKRQGEVRTLGRFLMYLDHLTTYLTIPKA
jgi:hypothetical protein